MLTTQPNTVYLQRVSFLVVLWAFAACALSNWRKCFLNLQMFFSICNAFLFLVVLWAFAACALSIWQKCFLNLQVFFSICSAFLFWVVLWAFAVCVLSNWGSCFLNLHVFSEVAASWAFSATMHFTFFTLKTLVTLRFHLFTKNVY